MPSKDARAIKQDFDAAMQDFVKVLNQVGKATDELVRVGDQIRKTMEHIRRESYNELHMKKGRGVGVEAPNREPRRGHSPGRRGG